MPTRPSARAHFAETNVDPKLLCASAHVDGGPGQYIARSTTTGWLATTAVDTAALARIGSSASMLIVSRPFAGTVFVLTTLSLWSVRNVTSTVAAAAFGLPIRTNVSKNGPVAPSARNQTREP